MTGFRTDQIKALQAKLQAKHVRERSTADGFNVAYLEGWHVINEANRIFGFDGWDRETIASECVWHTAGREPACSYTTKVQIRVRAGHTVVVREGCGFGMGQGTNLGEAHEKAFKEAETDATKRALMTFGNAFGLALYDKERTQVTGGKSTQKPIWVLVCATGEAIKAYGNPHTFYAAAKKLLAAAKSKEEVRRLWLHNEQAFRQIRETFPDMRDNRGVHFTVLFCRACRARVTQIEAQNSAQSDAEIQDLHSDTSLEAGKNGRLHQTDKLPSAAAQLPVSLSDQSVAATGPTEDFAQDNEAQDFKRPAEDKAGAMLSAGAPDVEVLGAASMVFPAPADVLPFGKPQRLRDRNHLKRVARLPCAVCGRLPSHAHHLTFTQPRAKGLKVSDEWTVPLCATHHRELHDHGNELLWWQSRGLDPISTARELWTGSRAGVDVPTNSDGGAP